MGERTTKFSDFTGKDIKDKSRLASVIVLSHPDFDDQVRLDALGTEVALVKDKAVHLVNLEVHLPDDSDVQSVWIPLEAFNELFGQGVEPQEVLENTRRAQQSAVTIRRPGRPSGSTNKPSARKASGSGKSPEELAAIRSWARGAGFEVGAKGRIKAEIQEAFDAAHQVTKDDVAS